MVRLQGVPETALFTLYARACEARRPDSMLNDPVAIAARTAIDYPFRERFGPPRRSFAVRARRFDQEVRGFLTRHPDGTVVALGDGLETGAYRVDNGRMRWLSVDLPELTEVRRAVLPEHPRVRTVSCSVLDDRWMSHVDAGEPLLIIAQGLLMYLEPAQALGLIGRCARRFPGATMVFDTVPRWLARRTQHGRQRLSAHYRVPAMPFALGVDDAARLPDQLPGVRSVEDLLAMPVRGPLAGRWPRAAVSAALRAPVLRNVRPAITLVRFASSHR